MSEDKNLIPGLEQEMQIVRAHFLGSLRDLADARRKRVAATASATPLVPSVPKGPKPGG